MKLTKIIKENFGSDEIVVVDVQPEYESYIGFDMYLFSDYINENGHSKITFLYNGPELGYEDEEEIKRWYHDYGVDENILEGSRWYEKGYGFFRDVLDQWGDADTLDVVKYMLDNDINDSREIDFEDFNIENEELKDDLMNENTVAYIPEVIEMVLENLNSPTLVGGGRNECLLEVELCLQALNTPYKLNNKFIF